MLWLNYTQHTNLYYLPLEGNFSNTVPSNLSILGSEPVYLFKMATDAAMPLDIELSLGLSYVCLFCVYQLVCSI